MLIKEPFYVAVANASNFSIGEILETTGAELRVLKIYPSTRFRCFVRKWLRKVGINIRVNQLKVELWKVKAKQ